MFSTYNEMSCQENNSKNVIESTTQINYKKENNYLENKKWPQNKEMTKQRPQHKNNGEERREINT